MTEFDPGRFEDKYEHYFPELQTAYRNAFEEMSDEYDSELIHALDQQVLDESEPFYDGADGSDRSDGETGEFWIELPEDPIDRVTAVVADDEKIEAVLDTYVETIEAELHAVFGVEGGERDHQ